MVQTFLKYVDLYPNHYNNVIFCKESMPNLFWPLKTVYGKKLLENDKLLYGLFWRHVNFEIWETCETDVPTMQ